jgi:hypothetical protein
MFEGAAARILFRWTRRIVERCVAEVAIISDYCREKLEAGRDELSALERLVAGRSSISLDESVGYARPVEIHGGDEKCRGRNQEGYG